MADLKVFVLSIVILLHFARGQQDVHGKGIIRRRPAFQSSYGSPCQQYSGYDEVEEDRHGKGALLAAAGGAAIGYYLGTKHQNQNQPVINNNIYNEYTPPCVSVQGGGWGGGGSSGGGGIVGGILGHHPILSSLVQGVQGGLLNGNGLGGWLNGGSSSSSSSSSFAGGGSSSSANRLNNINWNRVIRQFTRVVRIVT